MFEGCCLFCFNIMFKIVIGFICGILFYYAATNRSADEPDKTILERRTEDAGKIFKDIKEDFDNN